MKKLITGIIFFFITLNFAIADKTQSTALLFKNIVIPEAPPVAAVMVAYLDIINNSGKKQTIIQIDSPQFKRVEIHNMTMRNGMMNMQQLKTLSIKSSKRISLQPGGLHVMLIKPLKPLKKGDSVKLRFKLSSGEFVIIKTKVQFTE